MTTTDDQYTDGELTGQARARFRYLTAAERSAQYGHLTGYARPSRRQRAELAVLDEFRSRDDRLAGFAANPAAHVPGYDQGPAPQAQDRSGWAADPRLGSMMDRHPDVQIRRARQSVEEAHSRSALPDRAAQVLDFGLTHGPIEQRWGLGQYLDVTGSETYRRAWARALVEPQQFALEASPAERDSLVAAREARRALAMGTPASFSSGSYPVPYQLDPTVTLTSSGAISPLRQLARVEQIVGKEWLGVTSAGVVVSRQLEATEESDAAPTLVQPGVAPTRVSAFVPFSVEVEQDWNGLLAEVSMMLADAKDIEEATAFLTGDGTAPNPQGLLTGLSTAVMTATGATAVITLADVQSLEAALAPRFRAGSAYILNSGLVAALRRMQMVTGTPALTGPADGEMTLLGRPAWLVSTMDDGTTFAEGGSGIGISTAVGTSGHKVLVQASFKNFLIVDRIGMSVELVPHLFGTSNNFPTGQRGIFAMWRNGSAVLAEPAFRYLKVK
jgi:HK97 family phage major capsid protein